LLAINKSRYFYFTYVLCTAQADTADGVGLTIEAVVGAATATGATEEALLTI
jgi:hypothetical protein